MPMGFLSKRRQHRGVDAQARREADVGRIRRGIADARAMYRSPDGDFDLRAMMLELYEGAPTRSLQIVRQDLTDRGKGWLEFYEEELAPQWDGLSRDQRRAALEREIALSRRLRAAVASKKKAGDRITVASALSDAKADALACAYDAAYGTDYSERIFLGHRFG
jgi:hypothetical protein